MSRVSQPPGTTPCLTAVDKEASASSGCLALRAFHSSNRLADLRRRVLADVARLSGNAVAWKALRNLPAFQQVARLSALVKIDDLHSTLATAELNRLVAVLACKSPAFTQPAQLLLSPPRQGAWQLDRPNWHVDVASRQANEVPGVQALFLLDDVAPRAGATLALAGSHLLRPASERTSTDLRKVIGMGVDPTDGLRKLGIQIIEMSGRAGDVFLMDMRVLHTPSVNSSTTLRMMATCRFLLIQPADRV